MIPGESSLLAILPIAITPAWAPVITVLLKEPPPATWRQYEAVGVVIDTGVTHVVSLKMEPVMMAAATEPKGRSSHTRMSTYFPFSAQCFNRLGPMPAIALYNKENLTALNRLNRHNS